MPLSTYDTLTESVGLPGGNDFRVRGLTMPAVTYLIQNHLGDVLKAFEVYTRSKKRGGVSRTLMGELATTIAKDVPNLTTEIISVCLHGEEAEREKIASLPFLVQVSALLLIAKITTEEAGGLKNLTALAAPFLQDMAVAAGAEPGTLKKTLLESIMGFGGTALSSMEQATAPASNVSH